MSTRKCGRWSTSGPEEIQLRWDIISGFSDGLFDLDKPDFMSLYIKSKFTKMIQMIHSKAMWGIPFQITELFWASGANAQAASHILLFDGYLLFVTLMVDLTLCYRILPKKRKLPTIKKNQLMMTLTSMAVMWTKMMSPITPGLSTLLHWQSKPSPSPCWATLSCGKTIWPMIKSPHDWFFLLDAHPMILMLWATLVGSKLS